jgi:signal transduction histidine kinase
MLAGFSIDQMVAEYRALRSSVLLLWSREANRRDTHDQDILRFNEAIDKGISEAVARYSKTVSDSRDISLGILAHDLRTPLGAILLSAEYLFLADDLDARYIKVARAFTPACDALTKSSATCSISRVHGWVPAFR